MNDLVSLKKNAADETIDKTNYSRVEWVYRTIKQSILNNEYYPGYQALEPELAKTLGVSRTPVREALIRLENERLIELIPRRGMRVIPLVPSDMKEIYEILTSLETMAAEILAQRKLGIDELAPLKTAIDDMDHYLEANDRSNWAEADERFHKTLLSLCGNKRLATMANTIRDQGHRARLVTLRLRDKPTKSNEEHRKVYEAIVAGNWQSARDLHYAHRSKTSCTLLDILEEYKLPHL